MKISIGIRVNRNLASRLKRFAPGEARTHGLQIMRLTRCLLRYGGLVKGGKRIHFQSNRIVPLFSFIFIYGEEI